MVWPQRRFNHACEALGKTRIPLDGVVRMQRPLGDMTLRISCRKGISYSTCSSTSKQRMTSTEPDIIGNASPRPLTWLTTGERSIGGGDGSNDKRVANPFIFP